MRVFVRPRRHRGRMPARFVHRLIVGVLMAMAGPAQSAEELPLSALVRAADAVAWVSVRFSPHPRVDLRPAWKKNELPFTDPATWSVLCVPDPAELSRRIERLPDHPGAPEWQQAIQAGGYDALVFFRASPRGLVPYCEGEALRAQNFGSHPAFSSYAAEVWRRLGIEPPAAPASAPARFDLAAPPAAPLKPPAAPLKPPAAPLRDPQ